MRLIQIEAGMVQKQYIAKVIGVFPEDEQFVNANANYNAREGRSTIEVASVGNGDALPKGKVACTKFSRINTNGIRVHLQHTGHPIPNGELYLSDMVTGHSIGGSHADRTAANSALSPALKSDQNSNLKLDRSEKKSQEDFRPDSMCTNCPNLAQKGYDGHEEGLWLHCIRYTGPGWAYECPYPEWACLD